MHIVYSDRYQIEIGAHVFPTVKYRLVYEALRAMGINAIFLEPEPAAWEDLALVHTADYLEKVRAGRLSAEEIAQLELPWSPAIVEGFRLMAGGTLLAARLAWQAHEGDRSSPGSGLDKAGGSRSGSIVVHLGGGFHHAFANHGEGFCLFNDVAVAIQVLRRDQGLGRVAIIDLDLHHGNGTAMIFSRDPDVFTFSMHQQHNYPAFKPASTLDIGLRDGTTDSEYLARLDGALPKVLAFHPALVFYLAGADPYVDDQLGGLSLTRDGLRRRDRFVFEAFARAGIPLVLTLAGGYARRIEDTVAIHVATVEEALSL